MYNIAATLLSCDIETCIFINLFDGIAWKVSCSNKEELVKEFVAAVLKWKVLKRCYPAASWNISLIRWKVKFFLLDLDCNSRRRKWYHYAQIREDTYWKHFKLAQYTIELGSFKSTITLIITFKYLREKVKKFVRENNGTGLHKTVESNENSYIHESIHICIIIRWLVG